MYELHILDDDHVAPGIRPASPSDAHFGAGDVGWSTLGPSIACTAVATTVIGLRWYTRARLVRSVGLDDFVISLSMILSWCMCCIVGIEASDRVVGHRIIFDDSTTAQLIIANNSLWTLTVSLTKASILAQYLRIFGGRAMRDCCWILLALLLPVALYGCFAGIFLCQPVARQWDPSIPGHCLSPQTYWLSVACMDIALDFTILVLPMRAITGLHLPPKQKILIMLVFVLGFTVCIVSTARMATVVITASHHEYVQSGLWSIIWSSVEANVGIVCASLLALKVLVVTCFPSLAEESRLPSHRMRIRIISDLESAPSPVSDGTNRSYGAGRTIWWLWNFA